MCLKDCECFNICLFSYSNEGLKLRIDTQEGCKEDKIIQNLQKTRKTKTVDTRGCTIGCSLNQSTVI